MAGVSSDGCVIRICNGRRDDGRITRKPIHVFLERRRVVVFTPQFELEGNQSMQRGRPLDWPQAFQVKLDCRPFAATPRALEAFAGRDHPLPDLDGHVSGTIPGQRIMAH